MTTAAFRRTSDPVWGDNRVVSRQESYCAGTVRDHDHAAVCGMSKKLKPS